MDRAEELNVSWPPPVPKNLIENEWLATCPQREKEIICFAAVDPECMWVDSSQNVNRARNSNHQESPTVLPQCRLWHFGEQRFMTGRDLFRLQGCPAESLPSLSLFTDNQCADLAGNAFALSVSCALDIALLLSVQTSESDVDEAGNVGSLLRLTAGSAGAEAHESQSDFEMEI